QRILQILGNNYAAKLVSVKEETDYMNIYGFAGKPETAKKTRGDQYFFVNNRFIKSAYLNHAVMNAFADMIPKDAFPMYTLFIDIDPSRLDINVHHTKQEIKFEDEKIIYAFVQSAIKHALAQYSVTPTLDFELDASIQNTDAVSQPFTSEKQFTAKGSSLFQTFTQKNQAHFINSKSDLPAWDNNLLKKGYYNDEAIETIQSQQPFQSELGGAAIKTGPDKRPNTDNFLQLHKCFVLAENENGFLIDRKSDV